ncbi:MAG: hypothetical protein HOW97_40455 [Catenulispora sp.]|nr:hypothetical protein [Catenulispora sp.]
MNDAAARSLSAAGGDGAALSPQLLASGLQDMIAQGVVLRGDVLTFASHADEAEAAPGRFADLTLWECSASSFHLDDVVPVQVGHLDDGEPVIGEADQVLMLRHGLGFAYEVVRLVGELPVPVPVRCVIGADSTGGTFRFHRARLGESWLAADLDAYRRQKIIAVDSGPTPPAP